MFQKNDSSLYKGAFDGQPLRLSVNFILYKICCGQGQALSLRSHKFFKFDETQAPSDEGAVERSETEGEKAINIKLSLSLPQSFFC